MPPPEMTDAVPPLSGASKAPFGPPALHRCKQRLRVAVRQAWVDSWQDQGEGISSTFAVEIQREWWAQLPVAHLGIPPSPPFFSGMS